MPAHKPMQTKELINELRSAAAVYQPGSLSRLLNEAADRIETLDERVAIMSVEAAEPKGEIWK